MGELYVPIVGANGLVWLWVVGGLHYVVMVETLLRCRNVVSTKLSIKTYLSKKMFPQKKILKVWSKKIFDK